MAPTEQIHAGAVSGPRQATTIDAGLVLSTASSHRKALRSPDRPDDSSECGDLDPALLLLVDQITCRLESGAAFDEEEFVAGHPAWAKEIRSLLPALRGMAKAGKLIAADPAQLLPTARDHAGRQVVGDFHIVREIGRGGMGIVYEAEQASLGRRVALKVLPVAATLDSRAIQRFQLEAQVAGWLQHPRIVPVYAVGVANEVPYFAMQYIEGRSLDRLIAEVRELADGGSDKTADHSVGESPSALALGLLSGRFAHSPRDAGTDRHQPSPDPAADMPAAKAPLSIQGNAYLRTVARLGIQASEALAYAHDQGIIHRDVKPANLLLDRRGELWVADFGMADVQGDAGMTLSGDLPGTLRYMSPEQATGRRVLVDRRADIYSLGATLYELLTLRPAVTGADKADIIRRIAEEEPAPIRRLNPAVPVDLATIITKALSRNPSNRYETALKLADDLERFLDGRPIAARPVGPLVRSWRWCRRKPVQASLAVALVLATASGFAGITWNWREAVRQKQQAQHHEQEALRQKQEAVYQRGLLVDSQNRAEASEKLALIQAAKADAISSFLIEKLLRQASPENNPVNKRVTLAEILDRAGTEVGTAFAGQPGSETAIRLAIAETYHDLGDYPKSETQYRKAHEISSGRPEVSAPERLRAMAGLGHSLIHLDRLTEAQALLVPATSDADRLLGSKHDVSLIAKGYLANLRHCQGRIDLAETLSRQLVDENRLVHGAKHPRTMAAINNLGTLLQEQKRYADAERLFREGLALSRELKGPRHPGTIAFMYNLAFVLDALGRLREAETVARQTLEIAREVLGVEHPTALSAMYTLGSVQRKQGRIDDAEKLFQSCLQVQRRVLGPAHRETRVTATELTALLQARSRAADSRTSPALDVPKP